MCSILFSTKYKNHNLDDVNYYNQFRGPDNTTINFDENNNILFMHNLLSITGKFTKQPFLKDDIVCLYNGEIYNYKEFGNYNSDGECLIDLYKKILIMINL